MLLFSSNTEVRSFVKVLYLLFSCFLTAIPWLAMKTGLFCDYDHQVVNVHFYNLCFIS